MIGALLAIALVPTIDVWAVPEHIEPGDVLTVTREVYVPPNWSLEAPPLDGVLTPWGLTNEDRDRRGTPDGGYLLFERWTGTPDQIGVLGLPNTTLTATGPDGTIEVSHPEVLARIGADPMGPLPPPAPDALGPLELPEVPPADPTPLFAGLGLSVLAVFLLGLAFVAVRRRRTRPQSDPRTELAQALAHASDLRHMRALVRGYLAVNGGLEPGALSEQELAEAAVVVGWSGPKTTAWFEDGEQVLFRGASEGDLVRSGRQIFGRGQ